jgi:hypothetical protein
LKRPTRFYSDKQEKKVARAVGGRQTPNSGSTPFIKGDVLTDQFLIECKTVTKEQKQFTIKKEWLDKNKEEAFAMNREYNALVFDFGSTPRYYVIDEKLFKKLITHLKEESKNAG